MHEFILALFVVCMIAYTILAVVAKKERIAKMDDEDPFDDAEWKSGTPNDLVREVAKPIEFEKNQ